MGELSKYLIKTLLAASPEYRPRQAPWLLHSTVEGWNQVLPLSHTTQSQEPALPCWSYAQPIMLPTLLTLPQILHQQPLLLMDDPYQLLVKEIFKCSKESCSKILDGTVDTKLNKHSQ